MSATNEELIAVLGKKVKLKGDRTIGVDRRSDLIGEVIGIYISHPCQEKELKIFVTSTGKYTYRKLSEVVPVQTIKALAFRDKETGQLVWFAVENHFTTVSAERYSRESNYDMEKELL